METKALERFAQAARRQLLDDVGAKLEQVLATDSAELREKADVIQELRKQIKASSKQAVVDRVAYTWFNRFCALRFMDANHYTQAGVVSPLPGHTQPEILQDAKQGHVADELKHTVDAQRVLALLSGELPSSDPQQEAYRLLLVGVCNQYHRWLPFLFEKIADYTELLMPDDLLSERSLLHAMREAMTDEVCEDIEVIGWLYQFYISEKKDQVIGKVVKSEDIPAATQLFTPNWIVKYMVQNSLGAQWLATYPDSRIREQMEYYIEPAEQPDEVKAQLAAITPSQLDPEELTLIDPASGSGHILVEAYELFKAMYLEKGYNEQDLPKLILEKNLFGLEICPRAAQLTGFALMMKGRADDRRLFERGVKLNVMVLVDSARFDAEGLAKGVDLGNYGLQPGDLTELKDLFEHATTFGSLIQVPEGLAEKLPALKQLSEATSQNLFVSEALRRLGPLVQQAELLVAQYDAVVANPPYMGSKAYCSALKKFINSSYKSGNADLYCAFVLRSIHFARASGHVGMITIPNWMFLSSFDQLRELVFQEAPISSLVHNGRGVWGSDFGSCSFVLKRFAPHGLSGRFLRLFDKQGSVSSNEELESRFFANLRFSSPNTEFKKIQGSPVAYWVSSRVRDVFEQADPLRNFADVGKGLDTGDNDRFMRLWHETRRDRRWVPCLKGGPFRKWYGNQDFVLDWGDGGEALRDFSGSNLRNAHNYFKPGLTWTRVSSAATAFRAFDSGFIFESTGPCIFTHSLESSTLLAYLNSCLTASFLKFLAPSVDFQSGHISSLPIFPEAIGSPRVATNAASCISGARVDWDAYERSWDFQSLPILTASSDPTPTLESSYTAWITQNRATIAEMKRLEEENNRLFIEAYGLGEELTPDVPIEQITLTVNPAYRYGGKLTEEEQWTRFRQDTMDEFVSYAVGCMLGRYSLDKPGLILANQGDTIEDYLKQVPEPTFMPDADNVIPILDGDWFTDDIVDRFCRFLRVTFGDENYQENLPFLENALGKPLRKYFLKDFYKSHVQRYKKRPIYWLFSSPKGSFNALIYMHRYTPDTVSIVLNDYLREFRSKLSSHHEHLEQISISGSASSRDKTAALKEIEKLKGMIEEMDQYESEILYPLATQRIEIDLDDGVKTNYAKFGKALQHVTGLSA